VNITWIYIYLHPSGDSGPMHRGVALRMENAIPANPSS
jgi:hypothetical protein